MVIHVGDCRDILPTLAAGSVQTCVTSPPYFGLRDYGVSGQIGLESSLDAYVAELVAVFREARRVLADDGTLWLNLGDSYAGGQGGRGDSGRQFHVNGGGGPASQKHDGSRIKRETGDGYKPKDLLGVPWRVAFALQADGWYLRSDIVWHKPNPMPESVRDRPTKAHEYVFLLTKSPRYFYDADAIREPHVSTPERYAVEAKRYRESGKHLAVQHAGHESRFSGGQHPAGRNRRTVWTITPKPFKGAHFAVMPPALVEPCILAGTSARGQCPACGAPWQRVVERGPSTWEARKVAGHPMRYGEYGHQGKGGDWGGRLQPETISTTTGWQPSCTCNAGDPVPQTVLDPFAGAGTVGVVALSNGRRFVGVELNPEYAQMATERIKRSVPHVLQPALPLEGAAD